MDELGSALRHSDEANFRVSPFLFMPDGKLESAVRFFLQSISCIPLFVLESIFVVFAVLVFSFGDLFFWLTNWFRTKAQMTLGF